MNKHELVKAIAADAGLTQKDVNQFLISQEKIVAETLRRGSVNLVDFMSIKPVARSARMRRSLTTGSKILIPEKVGGQISGGKR